MPVVADTAYPRLATNPGSLELEEAFTPTVIELSFTARRTRRPGGRWRTLQRLEHALGIAGDHRQIGASRLIGQCGPFGSTRERR